MIKKQSIFRGQAVISATMVFIATLLALTVNQPVEGQVKITEEALTLPTYGLMAPEIMPDWRLYRYPYTMYDRLTNKRGERTYKALYVENQYVKALVLPELGGRLHGAQDKTNGYQFLYNQKVIKPALIGLTGAWISGGVEWNFPIGHRQSGFRDVDWTTEINPDSSKTVWVGETDKLTGMRWSVGVTVHPGRNWVETKVRLYNCTPYVQRFQYWATSAVRATWNYQAVIPTEIMTGHGKREFYHWPVNDGVDISYWKNNPASGSKFVVDSESDYFGGYSPEKNAGMVHYAEHSIVRGKKLWTWGTAPSGRLWEKILTDGDLPYYEPQAGAYSDNQPSLFWIKPGETKIFSHFWFPVRDIGVYDYANLEGALNIEIDHDTVHFGWSPTGENKNAVVMLTSGGNEVFRKVINADPGTPFLGELKVPAATTLYDLRMDVLSSGGDTLLAFSHQKPLNQPLPQPAPLPLSPEKVKYQDELFVIADHLDVFGEPERAKSYYEEAVKRDPGDVRCNTALGEMALKDGRYKEAVQYFNTSLERDETYFRAFYFRGLAELELGNVNDAVKSLNRSSYDLTWYAPAHFELAQLLLKQGKPDEALKHIDRSISENGDNTDAYDIKSLIQYAIGNYDNALDISRKNQITDPLDFFAVAIQWFTYLHSKPEKGPSIKNALLSLTRKDNDNHINLAIRFARSGFYKEAAEILEMVSAASDSHQTSPLVYYYMGYYKHLEGMGNEAAELAKKASTLLPEYCFPIRPESFSVLGWAIRLDENDALAHYLMGDLLNSRGRSEEAIKEWETSVGLNPGNAIAWRNLGLAYHQNGELQKAKSAYEASLKADPGAGKALVELGALNMEMKIPVDQQISLFENNAKLVSDYNQAITELIQLYVISGRYNDALSWLKKNHFNSWEGQYGIHQFWIESNLKQGDLEFSRKKYGKALDYYRDALTYPENLEVAEQPNTVHARKNFKVGMALKASNDKAQAETYFKKVIDDNVPAGNANQYYRARAFEELGEKAKAKEIYQAMLDATDHMIARTAGEDDEEQSARINRRTISKAAGLFSRSLALEGLGQKKEAEDLRNQSIKLYPLAEMAAFLPVSLAE